MQKIHLQSPMQKWSRYSAQYGALHAACAFLGRKSRPFWRCVGPAVTSRYRHKWLVESGPRMLNLGGGGNTGPQWLTADVDPRADVYVDATRPLPWPEGALDGVFLEEVVEHMPASKAERMLQKCHRCLKTRGPIRIATPDLRWFLGLLDSDSVPEGILL
jgi:hypothetical protein